MSAIPADIMKKFEAKDSTIRASRYYNEGVHELAFAIIDGAIEKNRSDKEISSWLYILKGDLLIDKGMYLYRNNVECQFPFEKSIEEFNECIKINPFNSVAWLGKSFSHQMIGLIDKDETKGCYHFYQAIFSADAGLSALKEEGIDVEREQNLWAIKGGSYYLLQNEEEGNKCLKKADIDISPANDPSKQASEQ